MIKDKPDWFEYAGDFRYVADKFDTMRITYSGDCDDFAITSLWIASGHSIPKLLLNLITRKARIIRVYAPNDQPHAIAQFGNQYIDNWYPYWRDDFEPHRKRTTRWFPSVFLKLFFGVFFK